jgi:PucR-like helix-turn-helix protein
VSADDSLQAMVDALSVALGRPVLLDDPELAPIAFSRQWDFDDVRSESILGRGASPRVREELLGEGIASATDLIRTAHRVELGMEERVCMPVRRASRVLGYIWLLVRGDESEVSERELEQIRVAAGAIGEQLDGRPGHGAFDEGPLLARLLAEEAAVRDEAAAEVRARDLLPDERLVLCLLAVPGVAGGALREAHRSVRRLSVGHSIAGGSGERTALVVSMADPVLRPLREQDVAAWVRQVALADVAVGQSAAATLQTLSEASRQARLALRVAVAGGRPPRAAAWAELGADRLVAQLPPTIVTDTPGPLARLLATEPTLAETLGVFLDRGGDVKATAEALSLHRSGLYYRLRRIEEQAELDLSDGDDRLLAHLAVRARALADLP